jgi:5-methylthioadenosine/S-adenosylhomocysteine deaminase
MEQCDTLIEARWCIPVEPQAATLEDHAIAVTNGRIVAILPIDEARARFSPGASVRRPDHLVIPGLVNAHTHAAMTLFRGFADDLPLERWLREGVWPAERRWVSAEMVRDGSKHAIAEMLKGGVTCFSDQYFFPEIVAEAAIDLHVRAMIGAPVLDAETVWAKNGAECLSKASDLLHDPYADHPLISTCFAPHSTDIVSDETFNALRVLADQLDRRIQIHMHESATEIENALKQTGMRPMERLSRLGLVNASLMVVHAVHLTEDEMAELAAAGVSATHCPNSNLKLASGMAKVHAMRNAGINVALGTDGAASNNVLDMLGEMRTAALLAKAVAGDATALDANTAIRMATLDGARALGLADSIGSLVPGKWADITCIDLQHVRSQPVYDPASQLVYTCAADQVSDVWVAGRHHVDDGRLTVADEHEILNRSAEWQRRIAAP